MRFHRSNSNSRAVPARGLLGAVFLLVMGASPGWAVAPLCTVVPGPNCLYAPAVTYPVLTFVRVIQYTDATNHVRTVPVAIRIPRGAPRPLPVAIWSHGGEPRTNPNPQAAMQIWGVASATAGYLSINLVHLAREPAAAGPGGGSKAAVCLNLPKPIDPATDPALCQQFRIAAIDRPRDIAAVIDELEIPSQIPRLGRLADTARIAVGGHSAGSGGAQTVAGAVRFSVNQFLSLPDPRPVAFVLMSPQAFGVRGFFDTGFNRPSHSWQLIDRPVFLATGDGDNICSPTRLFCADGRTPSARRVPFFRMPPTGDKYQLYIHDARAYHNMFLLQTAQCRPADQARCAEIVLWIRSSAIAFLDAHVRQLPAAVAWLNSNNIVNASNGDAEWTAK